MEGKPCTGAQNSANTDLPLSHGLASPETMVSDHGLNLHLSAANPMNKGFLSLARPFLDLISQTPPPGG